MTFNFPPQDKQKNVDMLSTLLIVLLGIGYVALVLVAYMTQSIFMWFLCIPFALLFAWIMVKPADSHDVQAGD